MYLIHLHPDNDDNLHNNFDVSIYSVEGVKYKLEIFNRFGETIFQIMI